MIVRTSPRASLGLGISSQNSAALIAQVRGRDSESNPLRCIGLVGCQLGDGVSTVAAKLATCAADVLGEDTLLMDANVTWPSVHTNFAVSNDRGWSELLEGDVEHSIHNVPGSRLEVVPMSSHGLRGSSYSPVATRRTLDNLRQQYTLVLVDLPPLSSNGHSRVLVEHLDGIILVIAADRTPAELARRAKQELQRAGARLLGVVVTEAPLS